MYAIYRVNTDEFLSQWDKANGREPVWVASDKRESCKKYDSHSEAEQDCNTLRDYFRFAVLPVNLEDERARDEW